MRTKAVEYSYPTSPNADRFKKRNGCWCVEMIRHTPERQPGIAVAAFDTLDQARAYAETLPESWDPLTR